jgi:acetyl esterase/lipase
MEILRTTPAIEDGITFIQDLPYVTNGGPRQCLDLYLPKTEGPFPVIVYIHGGAWLFGSKGDRVPKDYLKDGYALACINYRLSPEAVFPAQIEDCKAAVRWLRAHAAKYHLDPNRFAAYGQSAGGHLSALLGTTGQTKALDVGEHLEFSSEVHAVIDYYGPIDFLQMDAHRLQKGMVHNDSGSPESLLIGGLITENKDKVQAANPIAYLTRQAPPFLIVHGDQDALVPIHQSELLSRALQSAGVPVTFHTVKGGGHDDFKSAEVVTLFRDFLAKYLRDPRPE